MPHEAEDRRFDTGSVDKIHRVYEEEEEEGRPNQYDQLAPRPPRTDDPHADATYNLPTSKSPPHQSHHINKQHEILVLLDLISCRMHTEEWKWIG